MVRMVLVAVFAILLTYLRHLWHIPFDLIHGKPIRIDLPVPYLQIDVVLVSKPEQIKAGPSASSTIRHPVRIVYVGLYL